MVAECTATIFWTIRYDSKFKIHGEIQTCLSIICDDILSILQCMSCHEMF